MKIQRLIFGNSVRAVGEAIAVPLLDHRDLLEPAVNRVGGGNDDRRPAAGEARRLQDVQRAEGINVEIRPGFGYRCRHRYLAGEVVDHLRIADGGLHGIEISHIGFDDAKLRALRMALQPSEVMSGPRSQQCVEDRDILSRGKQVAYKIGADKAGTTRDESANTHTVPPLRVSESLPPQERATSPQERATSPPRKSHFRGLYRCTGALTPRVQDYVDTPIRPVTQNVAEGS